MGVSVSMKKSTVSPDLIDFVKSNILNISQVSRSTKIAEILDGFAEDSNEIYIIENSKKKGAMGAIVNVEYLKALLKCRDIVEEAIDAHMYHVALARQNDAADIPISQIIADNNLDINEIMKIVDEIEDEE